MKKPVISVVMSTYNAEPFLAEAIESVLNQTFKDFEFIIVDDCSTDSTQRIIEKYAAKDERIVFVRNSERIGIPKSLNIGLRKARGELIARQDGDDISLPQRLEKQLNYLRSHPEVCLLGTSRARIDEDGRIISSKSFSPGMEKVKKHLYRAPPFVHGSVMFRKEPVLQLGGYREFFEHSEDYDLWLRIADRYEMDILGEMLYHFRLTQRSATIARHFVSRQYRMYAKRFAKERKLYGRDSYEEIKNRKDAIKPIGSVSRHRSILYYQRGLLWLEEDRRCEARKEFKEAIKLNPADLRFIFWFLLTFLSVDMLNLLRKIRAKIVDRFF